MNTSTENLTLCEKSFTPPTEYRFSKLQAFLDIQHKDNNLHEEMRPSVETLNEEIYHDIENEQTDVQCDARGKSDLKNISECGVLSKNCSSAFLCLMIPFLFRPHLLPSNCSRHSDCDLS